MLAPVGLSVFCFRYAPPGFAGDLDALNERILVALQRAGGSYLSNARVRGHFALRGCVLNYRTTARHGDPAGRYVGGAVAEIRASYDMPHLGVGHALLACPSTR